MRGKLAPRHWFTRWRKRQRPDWQWTTLLVWIGVVLVILSTSSPWAVKTVREDAVDSHGDIQGRYYPGGLELRWGTIAGYDATTGRPYMREHVDAYLYHDLQHDINLPAASLTEVGGDGVMLAGVLMFLAGAIHGIRPGPKRRRVGAWAITLAGLAYGCCALLFVVGAGLHSGGWAAQHVGPFILWIGSWAGVAAGTILMVAVRRIGLVPAEPFEMPALPSTAATGVGGRA